MSESTDLKFLIKAKYGSIKKLSDVVGISENTINTHLRDGNWDMKQAVKITRALSIPKTAIYLYFFEPLLSRNESSEAS